MKDRIGSFVALGILLLNLIISNCSCSRMGTEESLRENIINLVQGTLKFSKDNIPHYEDELPDITPENNSEYDFIVIGAGSAGATIASRLSEVQNATVLLIEAGSEEYPIMDVPLMAVTLQFSDQVNWGYQTESSDKYCLGFKDHKCNWPRGKVTGGSSVLNYMFASRPRRSDLDEWADLTNDKSWSYEEMLKYFKKLEDFNGGRYGFDEKLRNKGGPMRISIPPFDSELSKVFIEAGKELGYPEGDHNLEQKGFSYMQKTIKNGERWSANRGYLHPTKGRTNLFLTRNSFVTKILIDKDSKTAHGVLFTKNENSIEVRARKEIILSAGAINSPQILMLSGIGPAKHLEGLGIEVIKDSPVGENLMDHVGYAGLIFKVNDSSTYVDINLLDPRNPTIKNYAMDRSGPLGWGMGLEAVGFVDTEHPDEISENNTIEFPFCAMAGTKDPLLSLAIGLKDEYRDKMLADVFNHSSWMVWPMLMKPKSRGKIMLRSMNPYEKPLIYANYFDRPEDVRTLIKGIRMVIQLSKTQAFQKYGSELYDIPLPCQGFEFDTDEYWECAIRTYSVTIYHPTGSCKMGRDDDETAVVDSKLKVLGVKNLRVADGSIMPDIVSAHPNIPIIAIGEKTADMIKNDWNYLQN